MALPAAKRIIKVTWRAIAIIAIMPFCCLAFFTPSNVQLRITPGKANHSLLSKLSSSSPNQRNQSSDNHSFSTEGEGTDSKLARNSSNKKNTVARAGGRRTRITSSKPKNPEMNRFIAAVRQWALPLFALTCVLKFILGIFGGGSNHPNVVYYSRSVYQSTTYTRNGKVETTRRENFQSNIPELVKSQQKSRSEGGVKSTNDFFDIIDKEMEDEVDSLLLQKW